MAGRIPPRGRRLSFFLQTGVNVFQYKKREVTEGICSHLAAAMGSTLVGAALEVERRTGKILISYVLFTNLDLTIQQQNQFVMRS